MKLTTDSQTGNASQFSEVKKKTQDRSRSKVKESTPAETSRPARSRNGPSDSSRGRGRGERGRSSRPSRGGASASDSRNGPTTSIPTTESSAWDVSDPVEKPPPAPVQPTPASTEPAKKTWASMFAPLPKPNLPVVQAPAVEPTPVPTSTGAVPSSDISSGYVEVTHSDADTEDTPQDPVHEESLPTTVPPPTINVNDAEIPPSKDKLTEDNVEHLPDVSRPAPIGTAASTVDSSRGPESTSVSAIGAQAPIPRQPVGYAATLKANAQNRSASFQRRVLEQREAVVLPANHAVDRATVQFGSLDLNGDPNVDEEREDAETRQQYPQDSPNVQPRTSLPPAPRSEPVAQDAVPKPAPGLPPPQKDAFSHQQQPQPSAGAPGQGAPGLNQFGRFQQPEAAQQKPYDPFGQAAQPAAETPSSGQNQSQIGGLTSNDYSYYQQQQGGDQRYNNYYGGFNQNTASAAAATPDASNAQRNGGAFSAGSNDSSFPSTQNPVSSRPLIHSDGILTVSQQQGARFGENQPSGHNTPNPPAAQHGAPQQQQQAGYYGGHPYYNAPYYQAYMNQYGGYGQQGFGGQFGKQGMYGQPHHGYGVPQSSYDQHSSSAGGAAGFGGDAFRAGFGSEYSRSGSTQPAAQNPTSGFADVFGRSPSGLPSQTQGFGQPTGSQQTSNDESLKPLGDKTGGPSPNSIGQPGRPSSTNQGGQSGFPPSQGFGQYPTHLGGQGQQQQQPQSQYSGLGNLGGQSHQASGYSGGYGSSFGNNSNNSSNNYSQSYGRGWAGNNNYSH
jgi:hypothetical protein